MGNRRILIDWPMPPSANRLWRSRRLQNGKIHYYKSPEYQRWLKTAGLEWMAQKPRGFATITQPYDATIVFHRPRLDADNALKALGDAAEAAGIVANDKLCRSINIRRGTAEEAPAGVKFIIEVIDTDPKLG